MLNSVLLDRSSLELFDQVIIALKSFEGKYYNKLYFNTLAKYLWLNEYDTDYIIDLLIAFPDGHKEFERIFGACEEQNKFERGALYHTITKIHENISKIIYLNKEHAGWLSDLICTFQHVKKEKGFALSNINADLVKIIRLLMESHPYFLMKSRSELVYPTRLGSELGKTLLNCPKLNKELETFIICECKIKVE